MTPLTRFMRRLICVCMLFAAVDAAGQTPPPLATPPWTVRTVNLDTAQTYAVLFLGNGDVWGTGAPVFRTDNRVSLSLPLLPTKRIGGFFEVCIPLAGCPEFGVELKYGLNFAGSLTLNAHATAGDVEVRYPMWVTIHWPDWRGLEPGDRVTVRTSFVPDRAARMTTNGPSFGASMAARVDADAGAGVQAKVFSVPYPPTPFPGFLEKHEDYTVFNSDDVFKGFDWTTFNLGGVAEGAAKFPRLSATGGVGQGSDPRWLTSYQADGFLNVGVNVTNLIAKGTLPFPLSDTVTFGPLTLDYHLLSIAPNLSAVAEQAMVFRAAPRVKFAVDRGGDVSWVEVAAGQSFDLTLPEDGSALTVTPIINPNPHSVSNDTGVFASAGIAIDALRVKASLPTIDLGFTEIDPSISINPLNTPKQIPISDRLDLLGFDREFQLTNVEAPELTGLPMVLSPDPTMPRLLTVCTSIAALNDDGRRCAKTLAPTAQDRVVFAEAAFGYAEGTDVLVNGEPVAHSPFGAVSCAAAGSAPLVPGQLCLTIPASRMLRPGTLHVQLFNRPPAGINPTPSDWSNVVDLYVQAYPLQSISFKNPIVFQFDGKTHDCAATCPPLPPPVGGELPLQVSIQTTPLVSRDFVLEFVSAGSVLVWDDVPLETSIAAKHTVTMDGATPVHTVIYDLAALVPLSLQSSGPHKLSFVNSGINAEETVLEPVTVFDPVPHIDAVYPIATSAAALTIGVNGTGFMPGSIVEWDGVPHAARYASSTLMELLVPSAELVGGAHPIVVRNPTSGPSNAMVYTVTPAGGGTGIVVRHALFRTPDNRIGDFITFSNGGSTTVDQLEIRSIKLHVGAGGYSVNLPMPQAIPAITPGEAGSLVVMFPAVGTPGQTAEIRIRALLNGKTVSFDLPVVLPN